MIWQLSQIELDFWETGQVHIANPDDFTILIKAIRNGNKEGYAAVDDFEIVKNEECEIFPSDAKPPSPITTTIVSTKIYHD